MRVVVASVAVIAVTAGKCRRGERQQQGEN